MAIKGVDVGAGVIDSSYRGELKVLLINTTDEDYLIDRGDKIAQLIMERCSNSKVMLTDTLSQTDRGLKGFGSSGR
jgi:dUTP pyrophosphatase